MLYFSQRVLLLGQHKCVMLRRYLAYNKRVVESMWSCSRAALKHHKLWSFCCLLPVPHLLPVAIPTTVFTVILREHAAVWYTCIALPLHSSMLVTWNRESFSFWGFELIEVRWFFFLLCYAFVTLVARSTLLLRSWRLFEAQLRRCNSFLHNLWLLRLNFYNNSDYLLFGSFEFLVLVVVVHIVKVLYHFKDVVLEPLSFIFLSL